jgi:BirA family biotin operon repressor/biotin-[acetyl-CoA-carboxylase] ligase
MKDNIYKTLEILKDNFNNFISGEKIAKTLGITRVGVYKIINKLIKEGYKIEKNKKLGYKLVELPFLPQELLKQNFEIPKQVVFYKEITSTMDVAKQIVRQNNDFDKILVIAEKQTKGKGRIQRQWFSPKGGLWFSLILTPNISPKEIFILNFLFSLSVANLLRERYSINATTKWPNDAVVGDKKICGILIEADTEIDKVNWCIVGVGVNLNINDEFFEKHKLQATSVSVLLGKNVDLTKFLIELFEEINRWYKVFVEKKYNKIVEEWKKNSSTIGKVVKVITLNETICGKAVDVSSQTGGLVIKTPSGKKEILSGDCIHLR